MLVVGCTHDAGWVPDRIDWGKGEVGDRSVHTRITADCERTELESVPGPFRLEPDLGRVATNELVVVVMDVSALD